MSAFRASDGTVLGGLRVALSGAVPEPGDWGGVPDVDRIILRFVAQFSALVMKYGGDIVHGSHPSFTPVIAAQAERFQRDSSSTGLTLVASKLFGSPPRAAARAAGVAEIILTPRMASAISTEQETHNLSLTALRLTLADQSDVVVAIGGKLHRSTDIVPGVLEELVHARHRGLPCFVVGSYGGFASQLDASMLKTFSTGNRMDDAARQAMAVWGDEVDECAGRLVEHLAACRDEFLARRPARTVHHPGEIHEAHLDIGACQVAAKRVERVRDAFRGGDVAAVDDLLVPQPVESRALGR